MPHVITRARRWQVVAGLILLATLVAGCGEATDGAGRSAAKDDSLPVTERLARYHESLLAETNWLWANMLHAQSNPRPDARQCERPNFDHHPGLRPTGLDLDEIKPSGSKAFHNNILQLLLHTASRAVYRTKKCGEHPPHFARGCPRCNE